MIFHFNFKLDRSVPFPHNTIETAVRATRIVQNGFTCQLVAFGRATAASVRTFLFYLSTYLNINYFDNRQQFSEQDKSCLTKLS